MIVVNLYGGPCAGKSTMAAEIFAKLKQSGLEAEYCHEWIKWQLWKDNERIIDDQLYIFAAQHRMLNVLRGKVDVAVCDSPLLLSLIYGKIYPKGYLKDSVAFYDLVRERYDSFENMNYYIQRRFGYNRTGRQQDEERAIEIDRQVIDALNEEKVHFSFVEPGQQTAEMIVEQIISKVKNKS